MKALSDDLREQTLHYLRSAPQVGAAPSVSEMTLIEAWLAALDEADLADLSPASLASALRPAFAQVQSYPPDHCAINAVTFSSARQSDASALLILNPDMPYLVDSFVMVLRQFRIESRAILNAVLSVKRDAHGAVFQAAPAKIGTAPHESYVLCLLDDVLDAATLQRLTQALQHVAADAASVHRDAPALQARMTGIAALAATTGSDEGNEVTHFIEWARDGGMEIFGYVFYRAQPGEQHLLRDAASASGVLRDPAHPVYGSSLTGIASEVATLIARRDTLSVVKADTRSTLHRDLPLDFVGVRDTDAQGTLIGEHCLIGLFTRAAAATPLARLPFVRGRIKQVLMLAGVRREGFRAEKFLEILEMLPRSEAIEAEPEWLAHLCSSVVSLYKQPRTKVFARRDMYGRHLNVIVFLPRERYSAVMVEALAQTLRTNSGASEVRADTRVTDGPLACVYLIATAARLELSLDHAISQPLIDTIEGWHAHFQQLTDALEDGIVRQAVHAMRVILPSDFVVATTPSVAYRDLLQLQRLTKLGRVSVRVETEAAGAVSIRLYSIGLVPSLSRILPALHNAGIEIDREQNYTLALPNGANYVITCLNPDVASITKLRRSHVAAVAEQLFEALFNDEAEDGRMNGLVIEAALQLREVQVIRAYASYWRQAGCRFSLRYIADCLRQQPAHVRALMQSFSARFNPSLTAAARTAATAALLQLRGNLNDVNHADTEDILRSLADLMLATLRTSYFQQSQSDDTILFKFDAHNLALLPQPRPFRELFVFARRFEGVHLRGGPVARGGLRWSDRMEDYRTEVMGLVKAQMVKNAVIVPVGAKGGFVCKMLPKNAAREVIAAEGEAVYRLFITGLLDLTDNRVADNIVAPPQTVCYDAADPYLVVAADKGTATFSDIANGIAVARGFWLGDAFASGGSNGYDHKKLGITAKGAWEAVKRHFYEIGRDPAISSLTTIGVGDMSGDVFGNGVLLSHQLKLVAAFDHRHIFIDPDPDLPRAFAERQRLFVLPRSSWDDYDRAALSAGGGIWPRSTRSIDLSPEARAVLGITAESLAPEALMHQILLAPVDLFYNGGIGTYLKASSETHAQVRDRANDAIRVDGNALRCKVVAEGGNLGATQLGRIEFALAGGRIFTDAIDNSAGVDCSDHEVNVKIWLDTEVNAGTLDKAARNALLTSITTDIEALVLRDNTLQTHLLTREAQAQSDSKIVAGYVALIDALEVEGVLSRELEQLPNTVEMARRQVNAIGLTAPELAVVIAHVKNRCKALLAQQPLVAQHWAATLLTPYFPAPLVLQRAPLAHPLANPILATVLANELVNRAGPLMLGQLAAQFHVTEVEVAVVWAQAWTTLQLAALFATLDRLALVLPVESAKLVDQRARTLQWAVTSGLLALPIAQRTAAGMAELGALFGHAETTHALIGEVPTTVALTAVDDAVTAPTLPADLVAAVSTIDAICNMADFLFAATTMHRPASLSLIQLLQAGLSLRRRTGIEQLERALTHANVDRTQAPLQRHALLALRRTQQILLLQALAHTEQSGQTTQQAIDNLVEKIGAIIAPLAADAAFDEWVLQVWALADAATQLVA